MGPSSAWNRLRRALPYRDGATPAGNPWHTLGLLVRRLGLVVLLLGLLRLVFWFLYRTSFGNVPPGQVPQVLLQGLRFDVATVVIWNAPLILLFLLPVRWRDSRAGRRVFRTGFMLINGLLLAVCCIDLIYFGFNHKRVGRDPQPAVLPGGPRLGGGRVHPAPGGAVAGRARNARPPPCAPATVAGDPRGLGCAGPLPVAGARRLAVPRHFTGPRR